jgi:hypothetical protein
MKLFNKLWYCWTFFLLREFCVNLKLCSTFPTSALHNFRRIIQIFVRWGFNFNSTTSRLHRISGLERIIPLIMDRKSGLICSVCKIVNTLKLIEMILIGSRLTIEIGFAFQNIDRNEEWSSWIGERMFPFSQVTVKETTERKDVGRYVTSLMSYTSGTLSLLVG